ncbi:unnamed protein product [Caretta caretta]
MTVQVTSCDVCLFDTSVCSWFFRLDLALAILLLPESVNIDADLLYLCLIRVIYVCHVFYQPAARVEDKRSSLDSLWFQRERSDATMVMAMPHEGGFNIHVAPEEHKRPRAWKHWTVCCVD